MDKFKFDKWVLLKGLFKTALDEALKVIKEDAKREIKKKPPKEDNIASEKSHSWRLCSIGEHWVTDHSLWIPPTEKRPGYYTTRDGHCAANPKSRKAKIIKDYLTADEMQMIADKHFANLSGPPNAGKLPDYPGSDNFDVFIRGWVKY